MPGSSGLGPYARRRTGDSSPPPARSEKAMLLQGGFEWR